MNNRRSTASIPECKITNDGFFQEIRRAISQILMSVRDIGCYTTEESPFSRLFTLTMKVYFSGLVRFSLYSFDNLQYFVVM